MGFFLNLDPLKLGNYYEYINKEAIGKDRVVKAAELQAVLKGS